MLKTLAPLEFRVIVKGIEGGEAFDFKIFEIAAQDNVTINPIFVAMFFAQQSFLKSS